MSFKTAVTPARIRTGAHDAQTATVWTPHTVGDETDRLDASLAFIS